MAYNTFSCRPTFLHNSFSQGPSCCFINPFLNHSYFTILALSQHHDVYFVCPPLQIQFWLRRWKTSQLNLYHPRLLPSILNCLLTCTYLFYRLKLIQVDLYKSFFKSILPHILRDLDSSSIIVSYQDYFAKQLSQLFPASTRITELIISTSASEDNYLSTLEAVTLSTLTVVPSPAMASLCGPSPRKFYVAPYGGNKSDFYKSSVPNLLLKLFPEPYCEIHKPSQSITIVARSHSYRKGADIFLQSLILLYTSFQTLRQFPVLQIHICGLIEDPKILQLLDHVQSLYSSSASVSFFSQQYSQGEFNKLLSVADIFIMPSRFEGSSLAALEALWHGIPSILTPACGIDCFIDSRHGALLLDTSPSTLAFILHRFILNSELRQNFRNSLSEDRTLFSWAHYLTSYKHILCSLESSL